MRRALLAALTACAGTATTGAAPAAAAIAWAPCTPAGFQCATLTVPLDPSGATPGTVTLALSRAPASANPTRSAVVALAGGPGQAALPFVTRIAANVAPALAARDLVVLDQRGTGRSGALRCSGRGRTLVAAVRACAAQIGPRRAFYRTAETVEDIEGIRREGGYERLVLYGTSYGTRVAEAYAARYPARVEALLLDSVALPDGPDVFQRSTLRATGRVMSELCANGRCRGITGDVRGDLAALARRLRERPLRGAVVTPAGRIAGARLDELDLFGLVVAGDLDATLSADPPAAVRSALRGDERPILRLDARARLTPEAGRVDEALFATTRCAESVLPWDRSVVGARERLARATRAARAIPRAQLGPFDQRTAALGDVIPLCLGWPHASPAPAPPGPVPAVPALLLAGAADTRTPVADARALAARIPGATLLEVPAAGHSVLRRDAAGCARAAVAAFFTGRPVAPCPSAAPRFAPTPVAPVRLSLLPGAGPARETISAARETVDDVLRQFAGRQVATDAPPRVGDRVGGLRSGTARWTATGVSLRRVEYVPGVVVSGFAPRARAATARLRVTGAAGPDGSVRLLAGGRAVAMLDGVRVTARVRSRAAGRRPRRGVRAVLRFPARPRRGVPAARRFPARPRRGVRAVLRFPARPGLVGHR